MWTVPGRLSTVEREGSKAMPYVAIINVPGYLPTGDDPPTFDTASEAWLYLTEERERDEDEYEGPRDSETVRELAEWSNRCLNPGSESVNFTGQGTVYGSTPGYDGDHDLGLAYSVQWESEPTPHDEECGCSNPYCQV
jgi:hypothetical protein